MWLLFSKPPMRSKRPCLSRWRTAYAALSQEDRNRGVAVVDIGLHSTDLVVYDGEAVLLARSLPISADHFTRDVAVGLTVQYNDAERLKLEYGCAMLGLTSDNSYIEVPSAEGRLPREAPRKQLNEILEARAEELFHLCWLGAGHHRDGPETAGRRDSRGRRRACSTACATWRRRVLNCPARNALPTGIRGLPGRAVHSGLGHGGGFGEIFGALENQSGGPSVRLPDW